MVKPNLAPRTQTAGFVIFTSLMLFILSFIVLGLFFNRLQIRDTAEVAPTRRIQDLVTLLKQAETKRQTLETEVSKLRKKLVDMEKNTKNASAASTTQDPELQKLYKMAGYTAVKGPGLVVTLEDNKQAAGGADPAHADPNAGKLQADDLLKLVNELKAAGATAISINDQRVVITTEIVAAGPTISVNQTRLTQPVVVKAIGDPDVLLSALKIRGGILEYLDFFNIKVTTDKEEHVKVPAYKGALGVSRSI